jgi:hypothetical protein
MNAIIGEVTVNPCNAHNTSVKRSWEGKMKKSIAVLLFFLGSSLFASDYKWDLVNALTRNDYAAIENIINRNINTVPLAERRLIINFTITYSGGETALRVLSLLQRHNVRPNAFDLYTAINRNQNDDVLQFIIGSPVTANGEILLLAMEKQRFNIARQFILEGVDVNYQYPLSRHDTDGMTALLYASRWNNFDLVQMLVERGADINARNRNGSTALSIAQDNGNAQITEFLIERGAVQNNFNIVQPQQTSGMASFLEAQAIEFQPGNYRLSGGNRDISFSGNASFGRIGFIRNNRAYSGTYQANDGNLTIIMDGRTFVYRIDSNTSFSGHGEIWVRIGG